MPKALLISSVPGCGKTTLVRSVMSQLGEFEKTSPQKLVVTMKHPSGLHVVGDYSDADAVFAGTDKLSMAVEPMWKEWVSRDKPTMLLEGDRLVSINNINFLIREGYDVRVMVLTVPKETLEARYKERGSNQPEQFLRAKQTKVNNIVDGLSDPMGMDDSMDGVLEIQSHELPSDTVRLSARIIEFLK